ncbi:MAG: tRNA pseudouridine synthase D [Myxococcales bacterium]|nr:tRNA pseudouridine synthase D [Myxococcales bacterium]
MLRFATKSEQPATVSQVSYVPNPLYATSSLEGIGGQIKSEPEDFVVEERPAYLPGGEGVHLYLWVEKRDVAAPEAQRIIARAFGVSNGDVGQAGNKDRRAVTRQWFSVPDEAQRWSADTSPSEWDLGDRMRVLQVSRHTNKLKTGHLWGNRFQITLRGVEPGALEIAREGLEILAREGTPNFYGPQRFGHGNANVVAGLGMLRGGKRGGRRGRFNRRMVVSALQAWLFNLALARRIREGALHKALAGDVMATRDTGGLFDVEDVETEQARFSAGEIVPTGPIYGHRMRRAGQDAGALEEAVLADAGLELAAFKALGKLARGTRRHNLIYLEHHAVEAGEDGSLVLRFDLPKGAYATVVLDELMKREGPMVAGPETFSSDEG